MKVALADIASRERYSPTFHPDLSPLEASLREVGQLEPLLLREGKEGWELVCGLKRIMALEALGEEEAEARVLPREFTPDRAARLAIAHNLPQGLNLVEKARAVERLENARVPREEVIPKWLPLLGLGPRMALYLNLKAILQLPPDLQIFLVEAGISFPLASELSHLKQQELEALAPMILSLRPGENKLREILRALRDLASREGRSIGEILKEGKDIWDNPERPRPERLEAFRRWLRKRRYPRFTALETSFEDFCSSLDLPHGVLRPPPSFEGEEFTVHFRFRSREEFLRMAERLREAAHRMAASPEDPLRPFRGLP